MAFVVLPVPPFRLINEMIFAIYVLISGKNPNNVDLNQIVFKIIKVIALTYMIKAFFLTLACVFLSSACLIAQVTLQIVDKETSKPLEGAAVEFEKGMIIAADSGGYVRIPVGPPIAIRISSLGYETIVERIEGDERARIIYLSPQPKMLDEVAVIGYEDNKSLIDIPGAIHRLSPGEIGRHDGESPLWSINTIPGVRMEERSPGSYRLSIRGSSLRAPFDVRNVKVYWNGIPFTDPNGITPLNLLDINQMGAIETAKGPAASIYGSGNGGVVNLATDKAPYGKTIAGAAFTVGSYGKWRYEASFEDGGEISNLRLTFSRQQSDGYREHTRFLRNTAQLSGEIYPSKKHTLSGNIFFSDLFYQVPGGLTLSQFLENPRQARPGIPSQKASVNYAAFLSSLKSEYEWSGAIRHSIAVYGSHSFFTMPFLVDFERETRLNIGGRATVKATTRIGQLPLDFTAGGEYQRMLLEGRNFENLSGEPGEMRFDDEVVSTQSFGFLKADANIDDKAFLTASVSVNNLKYDIHRLSGAREGEPRKTLKSFEPVWTPRFGIVYKLSPHVALHGSAGTGFSPPSVKEIRTSDGVLNLDLAPERGVNYETGFRGSSLNRRLNFDLSLFHFRLRETIVTYSDSAFATQKFRNAGSTLQNGLEATGNYFIVRNGEGELRELKVSGSFAFHRFRFHQYIHEGVDLSGLRLTGAPQETANIALDIRSRPGVYGFFSFYYSGKIPLNDGNTVFSEPYGIASAKFGWEGKAKSMNLNVYGGINNIFNETHSLGHDLNAFGERYYQPAPGRNFYVGLRIEQNLKGLK